MKNTHTLKQFLFGILLSITMTFISSEVGYSQSDTTWYKIAWSGGFIETTKEEATHYRPLPQKDGAHFYVVTYYQSGEKYSEGYLPTLDYTLNEELWQKQFVSYYENGDTMVVVNYKNGLPDGLAKEYFPGRVLKSTVSFVDGKREGAYTEYQENGTLRGILNYENGIENGYTEYRNNDGSLGYSGYMKEGKKEGKWVAYFDAERKMTEYEIVNGQLHGKIQQYNILGEITVDAEYSHGEIVFYEHWSKTNNSDWRMEAKSVNGIEQWRHYRDGVLVMKSSYKNGRRTGEWKMYSMDGKRVIEVANYAEASCEYPLSEETRVSIPFYGFPDRFYFPEDILPDDSDCLNGLYQRFDKNGVLWEEGVYEAGRKSDEWYVNYSDALVENDHPLWHFKSDEE